MRCYRKNVLFLIIALCSYGSYAFAQVSSKWNDDEIKSANTALEISYLNSVEKEAIIILNLARLYPQKFIELELKDFNGPPKYGGYLKGSPYKASLMATMRTMKALPALTPNVEMTDNAKCFAKESGESGYIGHQRKTCAKGNYAECCSYGMDTGKEIVMQLLIDHDVASLGHRKICFSNRYSKLGISTAKHKKWGSCCVIEMI